MYSDFRAVITFTGLNVLYSWAYKNYHKELMSVVKGRLEVTNTGFLLTDHVSKVLWYRNK